MGKCFYLVSRELHVCDNKVSVMRNYSSSKGHQSLLVCRTERPWGLCLLFAVSPSKAVSPWAEQICLSFMPSALPKGGQVGIPTLSLFSGNSNFCSVSFSRLKGNLFLGWQSLYFSSIPGYFSLLNCSACQDGPGAVCVWEQCYFLLPCCELLLQVQIFKYQSLYSYCLVHPEGEIRWANKLLDNSGSENDIEGENSNKIFLNL